MKFCFFLWKLTPGNSLPFGTFSGLFLNWNANIYLFSEIAKSERAFIRYFIQNT